MASHLPKEDWLANHSSFDFEAGSNERLQQARDVVTRLGLDPTTSDGRTALRRRLIEMRNRVVAEFAEYDRTIAANRRQDALVSLAQRTFG